MVQNILIDITNTTMFDKNKIFEKQWLERKITWKSSICWLLLDF